MCTLHQKAIHILAQNEEEWQIMFYNTSELWSWTQGKFNTSHTWVTKCLDMFLYAFTVVQVNLQ
jgi:hypothetical protein